MYQNEVDHNTKGRNAPDTTTDSVLDIFNQAILPAVLIKCPEVSADALAVFAFAEVGDGVIREDEIRARFGWGERKYRNAANNLKAVGVAKKRRVEAEGEDFYGETLEICYGGAA